MTLWSTETHLSPQVSNHELKLSGYEIFRRDRPTKGGGILVAIRSIKGVQVINSFSETSEEMLILRLSIHGFSFCMVAYYLPPGSIQLCDLFEFFEDNTDSNFVLLGDFNLPEIQWAADS